MLEPPSRSSRARGARVLARAVPLLAVAALTGSLMVPAAALGEDGPFEFPAQTETLRMIPGSVTRTPLRALVEDDAESEIDFASARLAVPEQLDDAQRSTMELGEDSLSIAVAGEGTWSLLGEELVFTPLFGVDGPSTPIALTIGSVHDSRSQPVLLTPELLELEAVPAHGSAGTTTTVDLPEDVPADAAVRLELADLPPGSTVDLDGSRVTVPDQGTWQLAGDHRTLTHVPAGPDLARQPTPILFVVEDAEGAVERAGEVSLTIPIISDLDRSAPYGEDIVFVVGEGQQHVDPDTLRLEPLGDQDAYEASADGTRVIEEGVGVWTLDRATATVRFAPDGDEVRKVAPMGITGGDGEGSTAATALLSTAYPILVPRAQAARPGTEMVFDLTTGIQDVRSDSLRFGEDAPEGASVSADGTELRMPGQGTWRIDLESRSVVMTPEEGFSGTADPVTVEARGVYADNPVSATMTAIFSPVIATMRDDEARTAPDSPVSVDVLGNDTAGSGSQPLEPGSVEISSLSATNVAQLEDGRGKRLVIPGEGEYTVSGNGAVSFTPEKGFTGRTTAITYHVTDSAGIPTSASLVVDVDAGLAAGEEQGPQTTGINSLLVGLMPDSPSTALVFGTIVMLLLFGGAVSLWTGTRIELDRRDWED